MVALFAGYHYYPSGGWDDFEGTYETVEAAQEAAAKADWAQVVSLDERRIITQRWNTEWESPS